MIVVINKIDKPAARCDAVVDEVFDLFVKLDAPDHILDFPVIFASAKEGYATLDHKVRSGSMMPLFDMIVDAIPAPRGPGRPPPDACQLPELFALFRQARHRKDHLGHDPHR